MRKLRRIFGKFWYLFVVGIMLAIFLTVITKQDDLSVYTGNNSRYTIEPETEIEKNFDSQAYINNVIGLSMRIPADWTYIVKDGFDTFVHSASASSVQIQVLSYYPMINNVSGDSLYETYSARGLGLTEFERTSETSYYVVYKGKGMSGITDYIEYVLWDRSHVAKIVMTFNDNNYEKLQTEIWGCIDSVSWTREDPVYDGMYLMYSQYGDFEFAVPTDWSTATADNTFYATYDESNIAMTAAVLEDSTLMSEFSQIDYTNYLSSGKQNFALTQFQQDETSIYAEATYYYGETQMSLMQYYISNGVYHYIVTYECPTELGAEAIPFGRNALSLTRVFYTPSEEELSVKQDAINESDTVFTPDDPASQMQSEIQSKAESMINGDTNQSGADSQSPDENNGSVSSFADALVAVAEIPKEKAEAIVNLWSSLGMSAPTYAEAIKGNDTTLILLITDSTGVNYYLYVTKTGDLQEIHMHSDDGPTINF